MPYSYCLYQSSLNYKQEYSYNYCRRSEIAELLKQNDHPINKQAKSALKTLRRKLTPEFLYSLQLMQVGLLRKNYRLMPGNRVDLLEMVEDLMVDDPDHAMKYLLESDLPGEFAQLPEEGLEPNQLAQELLLILHNKMASTLDNYPVTPLGPLPPLRR
jgi:hypothetical protein